MKDLLAKNSSRAEQSDVEYRAASVLSRSLDTISGSTVTVQIVKGPNKQLVPAALFENNTLGFTSSRASITDWESQLLTSLSFLCLASGPSGDDLLKKLKLMKPPNPAAAGQPSKPFMKGNKDGNQQGNFKKPFSANEQCAPFEKPNVGPFSPNNTGTGFNPQNRQFTKPKHLAGMKQPEGTSPSQDPQRRDNSTRQPRQHHNQANMTGNQGGTRPKQNMNPNKNKSTPNFDASMGDPFQTSNTQETASNLGDMLKQAAIEAAIGGLQNLAESLAEEKMNIPSQRKNNKK